MKHRTISHTAFPATAAGIMALVLWSSNIAFTRSATEAMGTLNAAFFINLLSGIACYLLLYFQNRKHPPFSLAKFRSYFFRVGSFFIAYIVLFNLAIGLAGSRIEVVVVGIINYLWPSLIFVFSIPILKAKANYPVLAAGIALSFLGTTIAILYGNDIPVSQLLALAPTRLLPYGLSLLAAIAWGIYSNMTYQYQFAADYKVLPFLFLACSMIILLLQLLRGEIPDLNISGKQYLELMYLVLFPSALAYLLWDVSMKRGKKIFITALSYLVPLASTLISSYYLHICLGFAFWLACLLVIAGALLCSGGIREKA